MLIMIFVSIILCLYALSIICAIGWISELIRLDRLREENRKLQYEAWLLSKKVARMQAKESIRVADEYSQKP